MGRGALVLVDARGDLKTRYDVSNRLISDTATGSGGLKHTSGDIEQFQKLMAPFERREGMRPSAGHSNQNAAGKTAYSKSDNRLFDSLMVFDGHRLAATLENPAREQRPAENAVHYTRQDLQAFAELAPDEPPGEDRQVVEGKQPQPRPERDVGLIRIIDFDKEHAREKKSRKRGNLNIKIRYFD
jgi:hypothetical protein